MPTVSLQSVRPARQGSGRRDRGKGHGLVLSLVPLLEKLRQFFQTKGGAVTAVVLVIISLSLAAYAVRGVFTSDAESLSAGRVFIDAKTNKPFNVTLKPGMSYPVEAPSGGKTGYPAEKCYWNKDGSVRKEPYYVLLNSLAGKSEPTFCPDCGRLVRPHNPSPDSGAKLPPTEAEFKAGRR